MIGEQHTSASAMAGADLQLMQQTADQSLREQATREQAQRALRTKKALLFHMRDELHAPLNAIIGYCEILLEDAAGLADAGFIADLNKILQCGNHLRSCFTEALNASQLAATDTEAGLEAFGGRLRYEMRTPLNTIIGYCELLLEDAEDLGQPLFTSDLHKLHAAAVASLGQIDELVRLSGIQAGLLQLDVESTEARPIIGELADTIRLLNPAEMGQRTVEHGRILVVDDNRIGRDLCAARLRQAGHSVAVAEGAAQGLDMLAREPFDLVLLDMVMPGMNGYQMLERLQVDPVLCHIPVIMLSSVDEIDIVVRCIDMGAVDYVGKDVNPVLLKARVNSCLEKKRLHDQEAQSHQRELRLFEELKENYQRLQELEQLRDSLTGMIVHDLRTPLTSLLTGLQTVEILGDLNADQQEFLGVSIRGGQVLLSMINDLLDISKMENNSLTLERKPVVPGTLVETALHQVQALAEYKGIQLVASMTPEVPALSVDEDKMVRTLVNLLGNAIKFTPEAGTITLAASLHECAMAEDDAEGEAQDAPDGEVHFAVTDTGEGIPRDAFERIFEKFGQVESRKEGRKMSTGLGLTFCKMVAEAHGGRVWVESELGRGSTFTCAIPCPAVL